MNSLSIPTLRVAPRPPVGFGALSKAQQALLENTQLELPTHALLSHRQTLLQLVDQLNTQASIPGGRRQNGYRETEKQLVQGLKSIRDLETMQAVYDRIRAASHYIPSKAAFTALLNALKATNLIGFQTDFNMNW
jgi:hypothetical protein